jgi:NAD+ synthase
MDNIRKGNLMARARMMILYDNAKKRKALVMGTENKSEYLLGYFTRFGDEASDIEPLRNLFKTQMYDLAKYLGVPEVILTKKPTAGLWEGQTDEGEFGFTYKEADEILSLSFDEKKSVDEIVAAGFSKDIVDRVLSRVRGNDFKHRLPILP